MGLGMGRTRESVAAACLHVLLAAICVAALVCSGDSMSGAPYPALHSHERVSSQPETVALPQPLSDALDGPVQVPGGPAGRTPASQLASSRPRSASLIKIGYIDPARMPS